jgi:putative nucleotidyltransferase with HDIG domain
MERNLKFFRSRLARRFFLMFITGALIPIMALAMVSYQRVAGQLTDQAFDRLRQSAKSYALSIYEHLLMADHQLKNIQTILANTRGMAFSSLPSNITERNQELFAGLTLLRNGRVASSWGNGESNACQESADKMSLAKDDAALVSIDGDGEWPTVAIVRRIDSPGDSRDYLVGIVNASYLWGLDTGTNLPPASEFSVWDDQGRILYSSLGFPVAMDQDLLRNQGAKSNRQTELTIQNEQYFAFSWSAFVKPRFHVPYWTVMVMEPRGYVLQSLHTFRNIFLSVVALSIVIVVFLTSRAIRKSLIPIDALVYGASQVANGLFSHRVVVKSKDEFQDLAGAFNRMTHELQTQFKRLSARSDLDRAILSVLDVDQIISISLDHSRTFMSYSALAISVLDEDDPLQGCSYVQEENSQTRPPKAEPLQLNVEEYGLFLKNRHWLKFDTDKINPSYLQVLHRPEVDYFIVFPIWIHKRLFGLVSLGVNDEMKFSQKDLEQMRGFSDHLAVAFANSNLLKELKELNAGALHALARTVDAKSSWTAGHSERVAQIAIDMAMELGYQQDGLDDLHRAALLHDIGKIGVPQSILNKPGKLTVEEYDIIKNHPSLGARILGPIRAYKRLIPIVEQHHERYDGKGYPFGKCGEQIHLSARIMALADTFDAMVSERPYRPGLSQEQAIRIIREGAGRQFDPRVVEAFNQVISRQKGISLFDSLPEAFDALPIALSSASSPVTEGSGSRHKEGKL